MRPRRNSAKLDAARLENAERAKKALAMRLERKGYREIGAALGVSSTTAFRDVQEAIAEIPREEAEQVRAMEREDLDRRARKIREEHERLDKFLSKQRLPPELMLKAIDARAKLDAREHHIAERRAALDGLDAPKKTEHSGKGGGPIQVVDYKSLADMTDEQLDAARAAAEAAIGDDAGAAAAAAGQHREGEAPPKA